MIFYGENEIDGLFICKILYFGIMRYTIKETQLKQIIAESVKRVLKESSLNEVSPELLDRAHKAAKDDFWKHKFARKWSDEDTPEGEALRKDYDEHERMANKRMRQAALFNQNRAHNNDYDAAAREAQRKSEVLKIYQAEFENACDDLYYGYGYKFWRSTNNSIESDEDAKIVWKAAVDKMSR